MPRSSARGGTATAMPVVLRPRRPRLQGQCLACWCAGSRCISPPAPPPPEQIFPPANSAACPPPTWVGEQLHA